MRTDDGSGWEDVEVFISRLHLRPQQRRLHREWRDPLPIAEASAGQRHTYTHMWRGSTGATFGGTACGCGV